MPVSDFIRRSRAGLSPFSQIARHFGRTAPPRFAGVSLSAPDETSAWGIAYEIANGEYTFPGLIPRKSAHVIDIGANVGIYALWAAQRGAAVTAYEPAPDTFSHLVANTREHDVRAVEAAVVGAADSATVRLYLHDERATRNTLVGHEIGTGDALGQFVDVPAVTIQKVLSEGCDLLKVDCEGGEFEIFQHVGDAALSGVERIVLEFHRTAGDPHELLDTLKAAGFDAAIIAGSDEEEPFGVIGATRR